MNNEIEYVAMLILSIVGGVTLLYLLVRLLIYLFKKEVIYNERITKSDWETVLLQHFTNMQKKGCDHITIEKSRNGNLKIIAYEEYDDGSPDMG